jgi:hypothetical protein
MPTRPEILLKRGAGVAALLAMAALALSLAGPSTLGDQPAWAAMTFLYLTGVAYGLGEMTRLYHRHRRRCRECMEGARPHMRWWTLRVALVLVVSVLPVLLLLPALFGNG